VIIFLTLRVFLNIKKRQISKANVMLNQNRLASFSGESYPIDFTTLSEVNVGNIQLKNHAQDTKSTVNARSRMHVLLRVPARWVLYNTHSLYLSKHLHIGIISFPFEDRQCTSVCDNVRLFHVEIHVKQYCIIKTKMHSRFTDKDQTIVQLQPMSREFTLGLLLHDCC